MMEFENAKPSETEEIVQVLKSSLGEGLMPKSVAYFNWKHIQNPFGHSKIILAKVEDRIVGVRVFMKWTFQNRNAVVHAVRAVDTSTLPEYQGKGIFSKLTLRAVQESADEGFAMVYNTPNPISMKGYLKLGWFTIGKMPIYLGVGSFFPSFHNEILQERIYNRFDVKKELEKLNQDWNMDNKSETFRTPLSKKYLTWRYADCPVARYGAVIEPGKFGIVFRSKKVFSFTELRICETWLENEAYRKDLARAKKEIIRRLRPLMVSCSGMFEMEDSGKNPLGLFGPFHSGPMTTLKPLAAESLTSFKQFKSWSPSLGTMELF